MTAFPVSLPHQSAAIVTAKTLKEKNKRLYFATLPAMMKAFSLVDPGFFDVIIIDESHRSIYKTYKDILDYFDALRVGLTATPVDRIDRDTYRLFKCKKGVPTAYYSLEEAINEGYLVPPRLK